MAFERGRIALLGLLALSGCGVRCSGCAPSVTLDATPDRPRRLDMGHDGIGVAMAPLPREPGPARPEPPEVVAKARAAARAFTGKLVKGGVDRREITAMADIRGYRLYKHRYFGQAHEWFLAAVATDDRYELSLYNAARTATLLGHLDQARKLLARLRALGTPLSRMRLALARKDPDLAALRVVGSQPTSRPTSKPARKRPKTRRP